jgi:uncharacterized protein YdaU (DUF1376 family)
VTGLYWHIDRWRKSTAYSEMTTEAQGAYRNLLDEATLRDGGITADETVLAFVACRGEVKVWRRVREAVLARFELREDGKLYNRTLEQVLATSQKRIDKQQRYRDRVAAERGNAPGNASRNAPVTKPESVGNKRRYQDQDQDVQELVPGRQASTDPPRQVDKPARLPASQAGNRHAEHLPGFCDWVCLPSAFAAERLRAAQLSPDHAEDFVAWAHATREAFAGTPVDTSKPFDFWRARWAEATADTQPTSAEREAWARYTRSLGKMTLAEYVRHTRRGPGNTGPVAPLFAPFITRKDQLA